VGWPSKAPFYAASSRRVTSAELNRVRHFATVHSIIVAREDCQPVLYIDLEGAPCTAYLLQSTDHPQSMGLSVVDEVPSFPTDRRPIVASHDDRRTVRVAWQELPDPNADSQPDATSEPAR
jgi:hypothetical protein